MKQYIRPSWVEGTASRQAHADMPAGTYEREVSKDGFFGPAAFFHHRHPPTGWIAFEGPLRPHAFDLNATAHNAPSPASATELLRNAHVSLRYWRAAGQMDHLMRNADGDELLFIHAGAGDLFCDYGHMPFGPGDYLLLPRGTAWRVTCHGAVDILMIEATNGSFRLPDRGLLGPTALFDPAMLDVPRMDEEFRAQQDLPGPWRLAIKRRGQVSTATFPFNPLDAIGWHGDLAPVRINVRDLRPVMSARYHLPPSAHTTFLADRFVVCSFVPRPFETDPGALKVPFFHNNDDYDEVIFYHAGAFFSRDDIRPGMMTFHPAGFTHGPHPKALQHMLQQPKSGTDEYAVMIDARDPLDILPGAEAVENVAYVNSWKTPGP
jgi:homogentisate 1,2-dioxygenase